jgi:RNA polymerase sigma-70 factor (ECF subfamily)
VDFRALYDAHFAFTWRNLRRLGVRDADIPDAVQDVFIVVHRKLAEFEGRSKITTWLFAICLRVAADRRKASRHATREEPYCDQTHAQSSTANPHETAQLIEQLLGGLPMEQRIVFVMFELEGFSGDEIAEALVIPVGTVRSRLRLARDTFRTSVAKFTESAPLIASDP